MVSSETRVLIDGMPKEKLLEEINKQTRSRFQRDNYAYLKTRLELIDKQEESNLQGQQLALAQDANRIAVKANQIACVSNVTSSKAYRMSVFSVVVAIVAVLIALLSQCTTKP